MVVLKEKLPKTKVRAIGRHTWADLQWNSLKKEMEALGKSYAVLRTDISGLTASSGLKRLKLQRQA